MARYLPALKVLEAAQKWRDRCLLRTGSIFTDSQLWTQSNLLELEKYFVENPDVSDADFLTKLERQLSAASPDAKKLAAEMLWVMYIFLTENSMRNQTKIAQIRRVWEWSGDVFPSDVPSELLSPPGAGSTGTAYNTQRWREFRFFVLVAKQWTALPQNKRVSLLGDPWAFASLIDEDLESKGRQFRHILLYLLFPETFERISTGSHKRRIISVFCQDSNSAAIDVNNRIAVDRELLAIRARLASTYGDDLDFYKDELRKKWLKEVEVAPEPKPPISVEDNERWFAKMFGDHQVWVLGAGSNANLWPEFQREKIAGIGWSSLGDLMEYETKEQIREELRKESGEKQDPSNSALACYQFAREIHIDDHVLIKRGRREIIAHGIIRSDYRYDINRSNFRHIRDVEWLEFGSWPIPGEEMIATKTLTNFTSYKGWLHELFFVIKGAAKAIQKETPKEPLPYTRNEILQDLFITSDQLIKIESALTRKKNLIIEGPPGVGKTFIARRLAYLMLGSRDDSRVQFVEFHQSFSYEDFVQGWRPTEAGGFNLQEGVFLSFCKIASEDTDRPYVFVIDEINRANISKVLGELLGLIEVDKRGMEHAVILPGRGAGEEPFFVPANLYIIGMMNTADRSLAFVDYALRRRFAFFHLEPAFSSEKFREYLLERGVDSELIDLIIERFKALNQEIRSDRANLGHGFEIGHSYFVPQEGDEPDREWYEEIIRTEIEPLLAEYWFDRPEIVSQRIAALLQ